MRVCGALAGLSGWIGFKVRRVRRVLSEAVGMGVWSGWSPDLWRRSLPGLIDPAWMGRWRLDGMGLAVGRLELFGRALLGFPVEWRLAVGPLLMFVCVLV